MANRWCDGFGRYGGDKTKMLNGSSSQAWAQVDSKFSLSSANPRTGSHCLRMDGDLGGGGPAGAGTGYESRRVFGNQLTEVLLGMAIFAHTLPTVETTDGSLFGINKTGVCLFMLRDQSNNNQCSVWLGTDGAIEARRGATVLGRTQPVIGAGAYQHVELYAKAGNSDGAIEIRVDEVTRLNLTAIDTVTTGNIEFSQWAFGRGVYGGLATIDFADLYCNDTESDGSGCDTFIGDCKSGVLMVNGDTAQADFALSAGAQGYALLDDRPPDDATYISTASTTAESDFELESAPANLTEILTARPFVRGMKDDAGTCEIAPSLISNSVKAVIAGQPVTTAFAYYDANVPLNPDTGAPWTLAEIDAALHVVERTA